MTNCSTESAKLTFSLNMLVPGCGTPFARSGASLGSVNSFVLRCWDSTSNVMNETTLVTCLKLCCIIEYNYSSLCKALWLEISWSFLISSFVFIICCCISRMSFETYFSKNSFCCCIFFWLLSKYSNRSSLTVYSYSKRSIARRSCATFSSCNLNLIWWSRSIYCS